VGVVVGKTQNRGEGRAGQDKRHLVVAVEGEVYLEDI
jgi:hypothetical protein